MQLPVSQFLIDGRVVPFPDDRSLVPACRKMAVDAVMGDVKGGTLKPSDLTGVIVPFAYRMPGRKPVHEAFGLLRPEHIRLRHRLLVHFFVASAVNIYAFSARSGITLWIVLSFMETPVSTCRTSKFEVNSLTSGQAPLWGESSSQVALML